MRRLLGDSLTLIVATVLKVALSLVVDALGFFLAGALLSAPLLWLAGVDDVREVAVAFGYVGGAMGVTMNLVLNGTRALKL